jgi:type VI protein secretion system component VasF
MGIYDRDWYHDRGSDKPRSRQRASSRQDQENDREFEYRRVPHRLSPWTIFFCRAAIAVGMLIWFAVELRAWLRH